MGGVTRFEDLDAWKLSSELEQVVYALTSGLRERDRVLCDQIRRSSSSAPSLISEGWGRFAPADFANYVRMAKASLNETKNHLLKARCKGYITEADNDRVMSLFFRAVGATAGLGRYLRSPEAKKFFEEIRRQQAAGTAAEVPEA